MARWPDPRHYCKNFSSASIVSCGFSSITQWRNR
jgi:hypothetical protein